MTHSLTIPAKALVTAACVLAAALLLAAPVSAVASSGDEERWVIGQINKERESRGDKRLEISETLSQAAGDYAEHLDGGQLDHHADGSPGDRAERAGWPTKYIAENLWKGPDELRRDSNPFEWWMGSPGHHDNMLNSVYESAGIGHAKGIWVLMLGKPCPEDADEDACRMTDDFGDASLNIFRSESEDGSDSNDDGPQEVNLDQLGIPTAEDPCPTLATPSRLRPRGKVLRFTTGVRPSLGGTVRVRVSLGRRRARVTAIAMGEGSPRFTVRFPSAGRWRVSVTFVDPTGECSHSLRPRTVTIDR